MPIKKMSHVARFMQGIPEGGIALHGTTLENALKIRKKGLDSPKGTNYVAKVPSPIFEEFENRKYTQEEFAERTIGSILFAASYSFAPLGDRITTAKLPAIVIFKGNGRQFSFKGYDEEVHQKRKHVQEAYWNERSYSSFGKEISPKIPPSQIAGIVRLTKTDFIECRKKAQSRHEFKRLLQARLVTKTLLHLKKLTNQT